MPGKRLYQVEVTGQEVGELRRQDAQPGNNLVLTLDLDLQRDVMRILQEGLRNAPCGAAIVMDPRNGEILAMVSTPSFDANIIGDPSREDELNQLLNDKEKTPMFPRAFSGQYPPGSVFKLVTGSAALQENVANRDTVIDSKGVMYVESDEYPGVRQPFNDNSRLWPANLPAGRRQLLEHLLLLARRRLFRKATGPSSKASASSVWPATRAPSATARAPAWTSAANRTARSPIQPGSSSTRTSRGSKATRTT